MAIIILRTLIIYGSLMLSMRLMGKRQLGELEISELTVAIVIADIAAMPLQDIGIPLINGLIPMAVLLCCEILVTGAAKKSIRLRYFLFGQPSVLIHRGEINQQEMQKNRFTLDELHEELRQQGITDIRKVEQAVLETSGLLNVILFPTDQPVTAGQMNVPCPDASIPTILINEGRVLTENLMQTDMELSGLLGYLNRHGIHDPSQVYLLTVDDAGKVYLAMKEEDS